VCNNLSKLETYDSVIHFSINALAHRGRSKAGCVGSSDAYPALIVVKQMNQKPSTVNCIFLAFDFVFRTNTRRFPNERDFRTLLCANQCARVMHEENMKEIARNYDSIVLSLRFKCLITFVTIHKLSEYSTLRR